MLLQTTPALRPNSDKADTVEIFYTRRVYFVGPVHSFDVTAVKKWMLHVSRHNKHRSKTSKAIGQSLANIIFNGSINMFYHGATRAHLFEGPNNTLPKVSDRTTKDAIMLYRGMSMPTYFYFFLFTIVTMAVFMKYYTDRNNIDRQIDR